MRLIKNVEYNKIIKRFMMAEGSILTPQQKQIAVFVLTIHAKFLSLQNTTEQDFLKNLQHGMLVAGKPFQHFMTVLYKNKQFSTEIVKNTFPNIRIDDQKPFLDLDHVLAIAVGSFIKEQPFFADNLLFACAAPPYTPHIKFKLDITSTAFKQTKQHYPDYSASFPKYNTSRYYDLKTGNIEANSGHIKSIYDVNEFEKISKQLFHNQYAWVMENHDRTKLAEKFLELKAELSKGVNWDDFYTRYQITLQGYLKNYPKFNPSLVYKSKIPYEIAMQKPNNRIESAITTHSCESLEESQKVLTKLFESSSTTIQKNFFRFSNPLGLGDKTSFISQLHILIQDVISQS